MKASMRGRTGLLSLSFSFFHFDRDTQGLTSHITFCVCPPHTLRPPNSLLSHAIQAKASARVQSFNQLARSDACPSSCHPPGVLSSSRQRNRRPPVCKSRERHATISQRVRVEGRVGRSTSHRSFLVLRYFNDRVRTTSRWISLLKMFNGSKELSCGGSERLCVGHCQLN